MSQIGNTIGIAYIDVTAGNPPTAICTRRVKVHGGHVTWQVTNLTSGIIDFVEVNNFRPAAASGTTPDSEPFIEWRNPSGGRCGPIPPGQQRNIHASVAGKPGLVYDYDIVVEGQVAIDPQLEI